MSKDLILHAIFVKDDSVKTISYSVTYNNTPTIVSTAGGTTVVAHSGITSGITQLHQDTSLSATSGSLWTNTATAPSSTDTGYSTYNWAGWYRYDGSNYVLVSDLSTVNAGSAPADGGAYVLYGLWTRTPDTYTITYNLDSGTNASSNPSSYTIETSTITLADPSKTGYTFLGWTGSNGTTPQRNPNVTIAKGSTGNKTYTANWQKATYTVKFVDSDGTTALATADGTSHDYKPTDTTVAVPSAAKTGYTFSGWTLPAHDSYAAGTSSSTGGLGSWRGTAAGTYTFTANWTPITYTINWNATWGNSDSSKDVSATSTLKYDDATTIANSKPSSLSAYVANYTKDGYKLVGWYLTKTGTTWTGSTAGTALGTETIKTVVDGKANSTTPYNNAYLSGTTLNLYAVWTKLSSFYMNYHQNTDGAGAGNSAAGTTSVTQGDKYTVGSDAPANVRTRTGYTLTGWNSKADGNGTAYNDNQQLTNVQGALDFYAQWKAITYTVKFNGNGSDSGSMTDEPMTYDKSTNLTANAFSHTGYTFNGWNTKAAGDGDAYADKASVKNLTSTDGDTINLYAQWKEILYTVNYHNNVTDTSVTFAKTDGSGTVGSPYERLKDSKSANWSGTDTWSGSGSTAGFGPDIKATRTWYNFKHWSTTANDSAGAVDTSKNLKGLASSGSYVLDLYAIWDPQTVTVNYITDGHGTVDGATSKTGSVTVSEVVNLATGASTKTVSSATTTASAPQGATVAATSTDTTAGYVLQNPVWTDETGATIAVASNAGATIKPTLAELRTLSSNGTTSTLTFRANFELGTFNYSVEAYLQDANGSYGTSAWKTLSQSQVPAFKATFGNSVNANSDSVSFNGTNTLIKDIPLTFTTDGQTASDLYEYDGDKTRADGKESLTVSTTGNVLKLYFKRLTYDLYAYFQTVDAKGNTASGSPASATGLGTPASYASVTESGHAVSPADTNHALTGLRWGQDVTLGAPSATGYTFAWAATDPARTGSLSSPFSLTAAEMATLSSKTAKVTGTFTVKTYTVTLKDTSSDSTHSWTPDTAGTAGADLTSSYAASTTVAADGSLGSWVPEGNDNDNYYFAGWIKDGDTSKTLLKTSQLAAIPTWTGNVTYIAQWGKKVVIVYNVGASDSYGSPIADGWTTSQVSLGGTDVGSNKYVGTSAPTGPASFQTVTGQALVSGNPKAKAGWSFAGWKVSGTNGASTTTTYSQAQIDATGSSSSFALNANYSYTFTAQWKPNDATVTFSSTGTVSNNKGAGTYTITGVSIPNTKADGTPNPAWVSGASSSATTFHVDDKVDLAKYQPTNPTGYTFAGWTDGTNTYSTTDTATKGIPTSGSLTLTPLFTENYVTFTYTAGTGGSITGTSTDTVYAVKHNTITSHTANASASTGYEFDKWTCAVGTAAATDVTTATAGTLAESDMGIGTSDVLTANRTYTANFKLRDIDIVFNADGTDGTTSMGTVTTPGSTIHTVTVQYGAKIPAGSVTVTEPYGYKLVGWDWTDGTNTGTVTGTASDTQGIFAKAWTSTAKTITVTAKFAVDNTGKYTVKYDYDPAGTLGTSGFTTTDTSRANVAWGASGDAILPASYPSTNKPSKAGYNFLGWFTDSNLNQAVNGYTFGEIYNGAKGVASITRTGTGLDASNLPYITLYGKWEAPDFTVYYDTYGKDVNGNSLAKGSSAWATTVTPDTINSTTVKWADANIAPTTNPTRGGYTFKGWTVEGTKGGTTAETLGWAARTDTGNVGKLGVQATDSYGQLVGNDAGYTSIKLIARWEADACDVVYVYSDNGTRSDNIVSRKWDESVNYYNDPTTGAAPTWTGHSFSGWTYSYVSASDGTKTSGTLGKSATTLAALRGGDADTHSIVDSNGKPLYLTLTASWSTDKSYEFVDVLVPVGMSKADAAKDSNTHKTTRGTYTLTDGATTVSLATDYVAAFAGATTAYQANGYDYDSAWAAANDKQSVLDDSKLNVVYVYFNERAYQIDYYGSEADSNDAGASVLASTANNPWSSANVTLPASSAEPSQEGYTFDGWFTKAGGTEVDLGKSSPGALVKLEDVFGTGKAPATASAVKAYAKFSPVTATIAWAADAHGSVSPTTSSATRDAGDTSNAVAAITATPDTNYVLVGWHYAYTDYAGTTHEGDLTTTGADWATLSNAGANGNCLTLTPQPWKMTSTGSTLWHDITFTAKFAASSDITVKVHHLYQDVNATGDAQWGSSANTSNTYTGTAQGVVADHDFDAEPKASPKTGYTLVTDATAVTAASGKPFGLKKKINPDDANSLEFWLYYTADDQNLSYQFVDGSGNVVSVGSSSVPSTATLPTGGTYKTGKTITVPASEDETGAVTGWTFDGWHVGTLSGTTYTKGALVNDSATTASYTMPGTALVLVGTWSRVTHKVQFTQQGSTEDTAVSAGSQVASNPGTLTVNDGEAVKQATNAANPNSKGASDAWDLSDLTVTAAPAKGYYLAGWYVYQDLGSGYVPVDASGVQVSDKEKSLVGTSDPLARTISHDTKFIAKWAKSFVVTYAPGSHNASSFVAKVYDTLAKDASRSTDAPAPTSTPAKDGWLFVGWGIQEGSTWNYLFDYDSAVDYGATVADYGTTHRTLTSDYATVTKDMTFTAFYKALDRILRYHLTEADGSEAGKAYSPAPAFYGSTDATVEVTAKTGDKPTLKGDYGTTNAAGDVTRTNYSLSGWKVMYNNTLYTTEYAAGSSTFQIPEVADGTVIHLYPVFTANDLDINYTVAEPGKTGVWGTLDNSHEKVAAGSVAGSTPTANAGYEFVQWQLDGPTTAISDSTYNSTTHKLTPTASGTYVAVFKQKDYKFATEKGIVKTATDTVTMPTGTQVSDTQTTPLHWTDTLGLTAYGEPTRKGYTFKGWDTYVKGDWDTTTQTAVSGKSAIHTGLKGDQLVSALSDSKGDATDLVLVATWTQNSDYQVTFLTNDGTAGDGTTKVDAGTMPDDAPVSPATTLGWGDSVTTLKGGKSPTRKGYTFKGWTVLESNQTTVVGTTDTTHLTAGSYDFKDLALNDTAARKHLYLKANWDANTYQVTFEAGTVGGSAVTATNMPADAPASGSQLHWGDTVTTLAGGTNPTWANSGYEFKGWTVYADAAHTTVVNSTDQAANYLKGSSYTYSTLADGDDARSHLYLVANWAKATLGVEYHLDGRGTWVADGSKYPSGDPMNPTYKAGNVEAKFDAKVGDTINLRNGDTAAYAGHTLLGWSETKGATTPDTNYDLSAGKTSFTMPGSSVVLYAVWGEKTGYAVSFEANDSTKEPVTAATMPADASNLKWDTLVSVLTAAGTKPARAGYTFDGWDVYDSDGWDATAHAAKAGQSALATGYDADGSTYQVAFKTLAGQDTTARAHLYLVAKWTQVNTYVVEFDGNGGTGTVANMPTSPQSGLTWGATVDLQAKDSSNAYSVPTLAGKTFKGWEVYTDAAHTAANKLGDKAETDTTDAFSALASSNTANTHLYLLAKWEDAKGYEVTFEANDTTKEPVTAATMPADVAASANLTFGGTVATKAVDSSSNAIDPVRPGYTFKGWTAYSDAAHTQVLGSTDTTHLTGASYAYSALTAGADLAHVWLVANWEDKGSNFKVTYDPNDSDGATKVTTGTMPSPWTGKFTDGGVKLDEPTRKGYTFQHWENSVDGSSVASSTTATTYAALAGKDSVTSVTLKAIWMANKVYNVKYDGGGAGSDLTSTLPTERTNIKFDATDVKMDAQTRKGYTFAGWQAYDTTTVNDLSKAPTLGSVIKTYTDATYSALAAGDDKVTTITLVAQWEGNKHNLTYDKDDASATWSTTASYYPTGDPVSDGTYTTSEQGKAISVAYGATVSLRSASTLTLTGKTLIGWQTKDGTTKYYLSDAPAGVAPVTGFSMPDNDLTLVPIWKEATGYSVTFLDRQASDKGTDAVTNMPVSPQSNLAWPGNVDLQAKDGSTYKGAPVRAGYTFDGWEIQDSKGVTLGSTTATDTNAAFNVLADNKDVADRKSLVLVAHWTAKTTYSVTFVANDGTAGDGTTKVTAGTMPANRTNIPYATTGIDVSDPTRPGYTFKGWTSSVTGADVAAGTNTADYATLANNGEVAAVTLTAQWQALDDYTVTYRDGVGTGEKGLDATTPLPADRTTGVTYDTNDIKVTELKRDGYTFGGWDVYNTATNGLITNVTSNYATDRIYHDLAQAASVKGITLVATWTAKTYTVTYHLTSGKGTWSKDRSQYPAGDPVATGTGDATDQEKAIDHKDGDLVNLRLAGTVARDGYTLRGWATSQPADDTDAKAITYDLSTVTGFHMGTSDVDLYPVWTALKYQVTFKGTGASDTDTAHAVTGLPLSLPSINYDDSVAATAPSRDGYTFTGWVVTDDNSADAVLGGTDTAHVGAGTTTYAALAKDPSVKAITLTATWDPASYEVRYYNINSTGTAEPLWSGTAIDGGVLRADGSVSVSYKTNEAVTLRDAGTVTYAGHTLKGWATGTDKTATGYTEYLFDASGYAGFKMPADNVYLFPLWDVASDYAVKFVANQPTVADGAVAGKSVTGMPTNPQTGLTWTGATSQVDTSHPSFAGFKFLGWVVTGTDGAVAGGYDESHPFTGSDAYFNVLAGNVDSVAHKTLTLTAKWALDKVYNVVFKDGVASGETAVTAGTMPTDQTGIAYTATVDHHAPTRVGYTFDGWTVEDVTDPDNTHNLADRTAGQTSYYVLTGTPDFPTYTKLQMTAKWVLKQVYNVHFVGKPTTDTGTTAVTNMPSGQTNLAWDDWFGAAAPTRAGYTFLGWDVKNTTNGASDQISDPKVPATAGKYQYSKVAYNATTKKYDDSWTDLTFTALWEAAKHAVTYVLSGYTDASWVKANITDTGKNSPDAAVTYAVDDTVTLRKADTVTRAGHTLTGWANGTDKTAAGYIEYVFDNGDKDFTMPDADVDLYPLWNAKSYQVTYDANTGSLSLTDPSQVVSGLPTPNPVTGLGWTSAVAADPLTLPGYKFLGWVVKDAKATGALTGTLAKTAYTYDELAKTDTPAHAALTLVASWEAAKYRLIYVDPVDANGATAATPTQIKNEATYLWGDTVDATTSPIAGTTPWYTGKSGDDWRFDGWQVYDAATSSYVTLTADDAYSALAGQENLTVSDVATATDTPALVLYATWTRRVPFVVDFVKRPESGTEVVESSTTLKGLDGDDIATTLVAGKTWADTVLDLGDGHAILGYAYNRLSSTPGMVGTLVAGGDELHLKLYYDPLTDYLVTYDATPGTNAAGATTATASSPKWETKDASFAPTDGDWAYVGHKIDHWYYKGADGANHTFDATDGKTFADIAAIIYGTVDGTEGRDLDGDGTIEKPVTLYAAWVEKSDYLVKYDDNYDPDNNGIDDKFLHRMGTSYFTPGDRTGMTWSATGLEPTDTSGTIVAPGVTGGMALYEQDGWNYSTDDGKTQFAAEGKTFEEIARAMYGDAEPTDNAITLYARWKQVNIQLTYEPVVATVDANGNFVSVTGTGAGGTVSRSSETVAAITGGTAGASGLTALGSTATASRGYHFIGWRRKSDGTVIYAPGYVPGTASAKAAAMTTMSLTTADDGTAATAGYNVLPDGTIDGASIFAASQNASDGYWHSEDYQALFVENEAGVLHYDKNADDATGTIADVSKPYGTLITLDSGTEDATADTTDGFHRAHWKLTGWNTKADGTGTSYALSQANWEMPQGETTLYAMWEKVMGRLIYDKNATDATGTIADVVKQGGTVITLDSGTEDTTADTTDGFHRKHYTLVGWNTKADYTGTHYDLSEEGYVMPDGTTTLYAEWQINKYEVSGPKGTKVTIPEGGTGTTTGGTTGGTTGTKVEGGYVTGGDTTKIEYGQPIPSGWITAIPEEGKHVDHWTYVWTDEDGTKHTETADDPTKFTVKGNGTITPTFVDDPAEPETPKTPAAETPSTTTDTPATTDGTPVRQAAAKPAGRAAGAGTPKTSDPTDGLLPLAAAILGLLLVLVAWRRRQDDDAE